MEGDVTIGVDGAVDAASVVEAVRKRAAARVREGFYSPEVVAQAERYNLSALKDNADFFNGYIASLHRITQVDIGDWEIRERRRNVFTPLVVRLKKTIRALLRFYTFRLWSQQNRANSIFQSSIAMLGKRETDELKAANARIDELSRRIDELEKRFAEVRQNR